MNSVLIAIFTVVHILVCLFMITLVLMQKSSEQGVGAAFGGGMTETVFGAGTTTALVRLTIWCACMLLATTLILAVLHSHRSRAGGSLMQRSLATMPMAPATQPAFPLTSQPPTPAAPDGTAPAPAASPTATPTPAASQPTPPPAAPAGKTP